MIKLDLIKIYNATKNKDDPELKAEDLKCPNCKAVLTGIGQVKIEWTNRGGKTKCIHCHRV
jgi:hypothetical protein